MAHSTDAFTKMVPGFEFLQGLVKNAGAALPSVGQWIAPTLDPGELEKRIEELRTVQFWLEQNARMLGATIQALEVQRMTLSTLKTMNVSVGELRDSLTLKPAAVTSTTPQPVADGDRTPAPARSNAKAPRQTSTSGGGAAPVAAGVVDPMQWWGALTKQFTQLAASAMKDTASDSARNLAGTMVRQSFDAAGQTLKKAAAMPGAVAKTAASVARRTAAASAPKRKPAPRKNPRG